MKTLRDKLIEAVIRGEDPHEVRRAHRRAYMRRYRKGYRKKRKIVKVILRPGEHRKLRAAATRAGKGLSACLRESALAYLDRVYLPPSDERLHTLEVALARIGNNLNQLAKTANSTGFLKASGHDSVAALIKALQQEVREALRRPPRLDEEIRRLLREGPEAAERLLEIILNP